MVRHGSNRDPEIDDATVDGVVELLWHKEWRARVVEKIEIDRGEYARCHHAIQAAPLRDFLPESRITGEDQAIVALPLQTLPKGPLVNFDVDAPSGQSFLLKRGAIASIEAIYISRMAESIDVSVSDDVFQLIGAICEFTPGPWAGYLAEYPTEDQALRQYLTEGIGVSITDEDMETWSQLGGEAGKILAAALDEDYDNKSSADNPLLALPLLTTDADMSIDAITDVLSHFAEFVDSCVDKDGEVSPTLEALADYGRRYEAIVQCEIVLDEPFTIRVSRDINLNRSRTGVISIETVFSDAISNHVAVSVVDPDVDIRRLPARQLNGEEVSSFTLVRSSSEDFAAYGSEPDRPYRILFRFRLTPGWLTLAASATFTLIALISVALLLVVRPLTSDDAALLVIPTTLIAGLIAVQQRTTLSGQLIAPFRTVSLLAIIALWCIVAVELVQGVIQTG